ncbi:MAG: hypothetical protein KY458_11915 [Actinobacteria bacterium]|nr:hypothetical protein [Actinomycetota bacterium]
MRRPDDDPCGLQSNSWAPQADEHHYTGAEHCKVERQERFDEMVWNADHR